MNAGFSFACSLGLRLAGLAAAADLETGPAAGLRLNQLQVIGTHNSYHLEPSAEATAWRQSAPVRAASPALADLATAYGHRALAEQLGRLGVRQLELDLHPSVDGADFLVFHQEVFDDRSTVATLGAALREIAAWSRGHPRHVPVLVQIELKVRRWSVPSAGLEPALAARLAALGVPRDWDAGQFGLLERVIRSVFAADELVTPDLVRGEAATLRDAVLARGWPDLDAVRGRVMFCLDNEGELRDRYLGPAGDGHGRLLFTSVPPDHPAAAWMKVNDPVRDFAHIQELVRRGFLVRTRADEELREAQAGDGGRAGRALASGAQFVSTDFPEPDARHPGYVVRLPGGVVARPDPVAIISIP